MLVTHINNDAGMPIVIGALKNGRGEGGVQRTPGGNSPPWHGAAPGDTQAGMAGQKNAAALSGVKSKEFGGWGHNQMVMDDTPQQQRLKLHTTQRQTWLQMGQARIHTGQAIGVLAGAIQAGDASAQDAAGKGLTVIAAQGAIDLQAQAGMAQLAALRRWSSRRPMAAPPIEQVVDWAHMHAQFAAWMEEPASLATAAQTLTCSMGTSETVPSALAPEPGDVAYVIRCHWT